jgi:hypothetical protein
MGWSFRRTIEYFSAFGNPRQVGQVAGRGLDNECAGEQLDFHARHLAAYRRYSSAVIACEPIFDADETADPDAAQLPAVF